MSYRLPREGHRSAPERKCSCCGEAPLIPSNDNSHNSAKVTEKMLPIRKTANSKPSVGDPGVAVGGKEAARTVPVSQAKGRTSL